MRSVYIQFTKYNNSYIKMYIYIFNCYLTDCVSVKQVLSCSFHLFRSINLSFTFTRCTLQKSLIAKCPFSEVEMFCFWSLHEIREQTGAKCSFCAVTWDQSYSCQTAVHRCCCFVLMTSFCWRCPCCPNRRLEPCGGSHAELVRYTSLTVDWILDKGPAEASRELSQMFLRNNVGRGS